MQDVADPALIKEMLRQRGLLADSGNIRMMPFATNANAIGSGVTPNLATPGSSAVAGAMTGTEPVVMKDKNGAQLAVDPNAVDPAVMQNVPDEELNNILPTLLGAAAGSALALYIRSRLGKGGTPDLPADPLAPLAAAPSAKTGTTGDGRAVAVAADDIIEGEWTEVDPSKAGPNRLPGAKALKTIPDTKALPAPTNRLSDENVSGKPKYLTAQELRKRKTQGVGERSTGPAIPLTDSFSDLTTEERTQATKLANALIERRAAGRKRMYEQGKKGVGRNFLPTLPIDKESAFNTVVRIIRENRKAVTKAVR